MAKIINIENERESEGKKNNKKQPENEKEVFLGDRSIKITKFSSSDKDEDTDDFIFDKKIIRGNFK